MPRWPVPQSKIVHASPLREPPPGFSADCMSHQLDFMATLPLYNATSLFGNTCAINDRALGVRHSKPPDMPDANRVFVTVPLDPTPTSSPSGTPAAPPNSASRFGNRKLEVHPLFASFLFLAFWGL
ncbi:hypothetical protein B0H19DRAFT_576245 [Mycena capillaripes]|nr:hypothetical protein B0H19DRAFT_576245 [Mycena capillaripes]